jgi:GNAT superfamily N-acetyltransferase
VYGNFAVTNIRLWNDQEIAYVAKVGSKVVGAIATCLRDDTMWFSLAILPKYQNKGIGKLLINIILKDAHRDSLDGILQWVAADVINDKILRPYLLSLGFHNDPDGYREMRKEALTCVRKEVGSKVHQSL